MRRPSVLSFILAAGMIAAALPGQSDDKPAAAEPPGPAPAPPAPADRPAANLNLLGRANTNEGESRRNENVQFNLVDNNALRDMNIRLGTTATLYEEFRADRSYFSSEFGNRPQSPIHLAPASKPTALHGSLFASHVNSVLNARSFFTAGSLPPAHENHYGFAVSSLLWSGASISVDAAQQPIRGNVNGNVLVPRADERRPRVSDPARSALIQRFLDAFPRQLPNRTDINERALNTNSPQSIDDQNASIRLNQDLGSNSSLGLRYAFTSQIVDAFQLVAGQNPDTTTRNHFSQATFRRSFAPDLIGSFTAAFDRVTSKLVPEPNAVGPQVNFSNVFTTLGPSNTIPLDRIQNRFRYGFALARQGGRIPWYAGGDFARIQINGSEVSSHRGNLYFRNDFGNDAITNFLSGLPSRFSGAIGNVHRGFRQSEGAVYAGGSTALHTKFVMNFGLRYSLVTPPREVDGLTRIPFRCDCNNVAPRLGFAWHLPEALGVVRAAYGLHYGEIFPATYTQLRFNPPVVGKFELQAPDLLAPFSQLNIAVDPSARSTKFELPPNLGTPYAHQYNLTWEPAFSSRWRLQLGYVGSRAHGLFLLWYTNRARVVEGIPQITATVNDRRPDQNSFDIRRIINGSHAYFDAGRATLVLPRVHGLSMEASYWFSKAIDLGGTYTTTGSADDARHTLPQVEDNLWGDMKGPSFFDQRHAFLVRASWTTPRVAPLRRRLAGWLGRWDLSGVVLLKTGTPFTVITGSDGPGFGNVDGDNGDRPNVVDPSVLGRTVNHPDTSVAVLPASAFSFIRRLEPRGNLGSNTFRKDGVANVNFSITRTFALAGERRLLLRAESVNLLNTPQFAEPWRELASPSFGFITNTLNEGRTVRITLRLSF